MRKLHKSVYAARNHFVQRNNNGFHSVHPKSRNIEKICTLNYIRRSSISHSAPAIVYFMPFGLLLLRQICSSPGYNKVNDMQQAPPSFQEMYV